MIAHNNVFMFSLILSALKNFPVHLKRSLAFTYQKRHQLFAIIVYFSCYNEQNYRSAYNNVKKTTLV